MNPSAQPNLAPVAILSIGCVTPLGRDTAEISRRLLASPAEKAPRRVSDDLLTDPKTAKSLRRADRFIRMASIAAMDAYAGAPQPPPAPEQVGLIVTSGLGPHCRGFKFIDGMLDAGDSDALPTDFSHSVHGAAASYIAGQLDLRGPSLSSTDFELGTEHAVLLAQTWLQDGICQRVLVGAVEELGDVQSGLAERIPEARKLIPGEGAVFFMLARSDTTGSTQPLARLSAAGIPKAVDLLFLEDPPIVPQSPPAISARQTASVTGHFGHSASASAFALLAAVLRVSAPGREAVDNAATLRTSFGRMASLLVTANR
jgi:3-oxoacyl-[acyl-carrier-protein] synthase II